MYTQGYYSGYGGDYYDHVYNAQPSYPPPPDRSNITRGSSARPAPHPSNHPSDHPSDHHHQHHSSDHHHQHNHNYRSQIAKRDSYHHQQLISRNLHQKGYYDPLCSMRPGPLASEYNLERPSSKTENINSALAFVRKELGKLSGEAHVIYESVRKFGRFDIENGRIVLDKEGKEKEQDYIDGLGRLWQIGDGYIYVKQTEHKKTFAKVYVYHVDHNSYERLKAKEAADIISGDPFWEKISSTTELQFV